MKKRWTAALLALILTVTLLPGVAYAAPAGRTAGDRLTGMDRVVYDTLRSEIIKIANGTRSSTTFHIPDQSALSWTLKELGLSGGRGENVLNKLEAKFSQTVHMNNIFYALAADCPYELYWSDNQFSWGFSYTRQGDKLNLVDITIKFQAAQSYRANNSATTVSASKVSAAKKAAEAAKAIVDKYQDLSDYEKLDAYREEICRLTSYNMTAYHGGQPYGDPWQMIYVFDGDPNTNVVCEGYAKAFKYLCDLSDFDRDITCYLVFGWMDGGNHMWNVVQIDGKNYLADVTNCDSKMIGSDGQLFLSGGAVSGDGQTCTISKENCHAVYSYAPVHDELFTGGYPVISSVDYVDEPSVTPPSESPQPAEPGTSVPAFSDVAEGAYYAEAVAWAVEQGITNGTSGTTFSPDKTCTDAEILTFLWRAAGKPDNSYKVSDEGSFYSAALFWAYDMGMLLPSQFAPDTPCTRASAVGYIWWALHDPGDDAPAVSFTDVPADSNYAEEVAWAVGKGITNGTSDTTFSPDSTCTRGQIVTFLYRAYH